MLESLLREFAEILQKETEIELYNEAGLQHEMAIFIRERLGSTFKVELERNVSVVFKGNINHFYKKEMDIYVYNKANTSEKYCVELKLIHGRSVPRRMFQAFEDVLFLEQLKSKGFTGGYLFFTTPKSSFWLTKKADSFLYKCFQGESVHFCSLQKSDVPSFIAKDFDNDMVLTLKQEYQCKWNDWKIQEKKTWRYFLLAV